MAVVSKLWCKHCRDLHFLWRHFRPRPTHTHKYSTVGVHRQHNTQTHWKTNVDTHMKSTLKCCCPQTARMFLNIVKEQDKMLPRKTVFETRMRGGVQETPGRTRICAIDGWEYTAVQHPDKTTIRPVPKWIHVNGSFLYSEWVYKLGLHS